MRDLRLTKLVKKYESSLFVADVMGVKQILRDHVTMVYYNINGHRVGVLHPTPQYVCALTDNWSPKGMPVDWGQVPIWEKLLEIDGWRAEQFKKLIDAHEKTKESQARDFRNKCEDAAFEMHPHFKKLTSDINVSSLEKIDKRRKKESRKWQ